MPCVAKANGRTRSTGMYYVYILQQLADPSVTYVGFTTDPHARLARHNAGASPHTAKGRPWRMAFFCAFPDKCKALDFERYLKSHSGKAFSTKRLI